VAHTCNPSYSGDRDQEDHGLKPAWAKRFLETLSQKNPSQKRAGGAPQGVVPEFKPQYCKKKKEKEKEKKNCNVIKSLQNITSGKSQQSDHSVGLHHTGSVYQPDEQPSKERTCSKGEKYIYLPMLLHHF
jgi:hypothetical protein